MKASLYSYCKYNTMNSSAIQIQTISQDLPTDHINLCFVGGVSTGKSTLLNAVFCEEFSQCKIKRTTMVPTIYVETTFGTSTSPTEIYQAVSYTNHRLIEKTENGDSVNEGDYQELVFSVGKLHMSILDEGLVTIYDIPGLNDARTKDMYYRYLENAFSSFNIVVFVVDIHSGLNTSDENDILQFIASHTKEQFVNYNKKIYTLVVVNKSDDLRLVGDSKIPQLTGELAEMFGQVDKTVRQRFDDMNISDNLLDIIPLCAVDAYLYRMVQKHGSAFKLTPEQILKIGINEMGKKFSTLTNEVQSEKVYEFLEDRDFIDTMISLSGFYHLEQTLSRLFTRPRDNQPYSLGKRIRLDNMLLRINGLPKVQIVRNGKLSGVYSCNAIRTHIQELDQLKLVDEPTYQSMAQKWIDELVSDIQHCVTNGYGKTEYLQLYDDFMEFLGSVVTPHLGEWVEHMKMNALPDYFVMSVWGRLKRFINQERITFVDIAKSLEIIERLGIYDRSHVWDFTQMLTARRSCPFYHDIPKERIRTDCKNEENMLIDAMDKLYDKGFQIEADMIVRYILFQIIKDESPHQIMRRKFIYRQTKEAHIQTYIDFRIDPNNLPSVDNILDIVVRENFQRWCPDFRIEEYYLSKYGYPDNNSEDR